MQGDRFSLSQQVLNFERTLDQLRNMMTGRNMTRYLEKAIAFMSFGSNDYINNYLMSSLYDSSFTYKPPEFANLLLNRYARQILVTNTTLYMWYAIFISWSIVYVLAIKRLYLWLGFIQCRIAKVFHSRNSTYWLHSKSEGNRSSASRKMCGLS